MGECPHSAWGFSPTPKPLGKAWTGRFRNGCIVDFKLMRVCDPWNSVEFSRVGSPVRGFSMKLSLWGLCE